MASPRPSCPFTTTRRKFSGGPTAASQLQWTAKSREVCGGGRAAKCLSAPPSGLLLSIFLLQAGRVLFAGKSDVRGGGHCFENTNRQHALKISTQQTICYI